MKLTKEQAVSEFRKMWNWIADETERRKGVVFKEEYFVEHGMDPEDVANECYLCEYDVQGDAEQQACYFCPIDFGEMEEYDENGYQHTPCIDALTSPFKKWCKQNTYCMCKKDGYDELAKYAREVANLPEREE